MKIVEVPMVKTAQSENQVLIYLNLLSYIFLFLREYWDTKVWNEN